ncbi:hypothetical protein [Burkholderia singularis]|nr:hypothetical protein [Burkholderia singularis]
MLDISRPSSRRSAWAPCFMRGELGRVPTASRHGRLFADARAIACTTQTEKSDHCIMSPCLFNFHGDAIMRSSLNFPAGQSSSAASSTTDGASEPNAGGSGSSPARGAAEPAEAGRQRDPADVLPLAGQVVRISSPARASFLAAASALAGLRGARPGPSGVQMAQRNLEAFKRQVDQLHQDARRQAGQPLPQPELMADFIISVGQGIGRMSREAFAMKHGISTHFARAIGNEDGTLTQFGRWLLRNDSSN